jgi:predicted secreted protein
MHVTSAIVLYAIIWFLTLLIVAPIRLVTQGDRGEIVPGTHASSPEVHHLKAKMWISTGVAFVIWAIIVAIIVTDVISVRDFDWFNRMK